VWEQSFPDVHGVALPVVDPATGTGSRLRLSRREARALRREHEERASRLGEELASCGLRAISLSTTDTRAIDSAFVEWAEERRRARR
jgi:hypothetical protein